jgi:hypothetical protein
VPLLYQREVRVASPVGDRFASPLLAPQREKDPPAKPAAPPAAPHMPPPNAAAEDPPGPGSFAAASAARGDGGAWNLADDEVVVLEVSKSSQSPPPPVNAEASASSGPSGEVRPSSMLATSVSCSCISAPASDQGMEVWSPPSMSESDRSASDECDDPVGLSGGPSKADMWGG